MEYQPGVCNIGRDERRRRRFFGVVSTVAAVAVVAGVLTSGVSATFVLASFPFFFGGFLGILQDYFRFCAGLAALARYDLSGSGGDAGSVVERDALRRDRRRALQIVAYSLATAAVATAGAYGLVVLVG